MASKQELLDTIQVLREDLLSLSNREGAVVAALRATTTARDELADANEKLRESVKSQRLAIEANERQARDLGNRLALLEVANQAAVIRNAKLSDENNKLHDSLAHTARQLSAIQLIVEG